MDFTLLGMLLAVVPTGIGATIGEALVAKASLAALGKNPDLAKTLKSLSVLGIALVESAAIYGLVVALLILFLGVGTSQAIRAGGIIGGVGIFTCIYEGIVIKQAIESILRNPEIESEVRTNMILFVALVESAAIYALVSALLIIFLG